LLERGDEQFHRIAPKLWELTRPLVDVVWPAMKGLEHTRGRRSEDLSNPL